MNHNPMRYNCETSGCFNKKKRVKLEHLSPACARNTGFTDVDGLHENNGCFLMVEWKADGAPSLYAQDLIFLRFSLVPGFMAVSVRGDAETMDVKAIQKWWQGKPSDWIETDMAGLLDLIRAFDAYADAQLPLSRRLKAC